MLRWDKKVKELNQNELEDYVRKLQEETPDIGPLVDEVDKKVGQMLPTGQEPICQLMYYEPYTDPRLAYSDHYAPIADCVRGMYLTRCKHVSEFYADMLIPLPSVIDTEASSLLTPFPFTVEMPALNPAFRSKELLVDILDEAGNADSNRLKVS